MYFFLKISFSPCNLTHHSQSPVTTGDPGTNSSTNSFASSVREGLSAGKEEIEAVKDDEAKVEVCGVSVIETLLTVLLLVYICYF